VSIEERILASHPLRRTRKLADQALDRLNPTFCELYAVEGSPSVPTEQLLLASLLKEFYGIRSERLLFEQLQYNLLFRLSRVNQLERRFASNNCYLFC
jgi:transposase